MADRVAEIRARLARYAGSPAPLETRDLVYSAVLGKPYADLEWACGEIERLTRELRDAHAVVRDEFPAVRSIISDAAYRDGAVAMREKAVERLVNICEPDYATIIELLPIPEPKR